jgi:hypothetical protein
MDDLLVLAAVGFAYAVYRRIRLSSSIDYCPACKEGSMAEAGSSSSESAPGLVERECMLCGHRTQTEKGSE